MEDINKMDMYRAIALAEGSIDGDEGERLGAWQHLIDTGAAWTLQGAIDRMAADLIEQGLCSEYPRRK